MADGDLITQDWQLEVGGVLLGEGSPFAIVSISGLLDLPEVRTSDVARLHTHGLAPGVDLLGARVVTVTLEVDGGGMASAALSAAVDDLAAATSAMEEAPLYLQVPGVAGGGKRFLVARARRRSIPVDLDFLYGLPVASVEFHASDPRLFAVETSTGLTGLPVAGPGVSWPLSWPLSWGDTTGGAIEAVNEGTFAVRPVLRIDGPVDDPEVLSLTTGASLGLGSVGAGNYLLVDCATGSILLNGTNPRYSATASPTTLELAPGSNTILFRAANYSADARLSMVWRSAWT
jgi:hypothetical protein